MTSIRQNKEIVLGILSLILFIGGAGFVIWHTTKASAETMSNISESTSGSKKVKNAEHTKSWMAIGSSKDYEVIASRDLFQAQGNQNKPVTAAQPLPQLPPLRISNVRLNEVTNQQQSPIHTPQTDKITVVGVVSMDGQTVAIVEDLSQGETRWVPVGGSAFGYRLASLSADKATLEREGKTYEVEYGANKPEVRPRSTSNLVTPSTTTLQPFPMAAGATDPNSPRSWDWRNMTDEQRRAARDYFRNLRGDRRDADGDRGRRNRGGEGEANGVTTYAAPGDGGGALMMYQAN